MTKLVVYVIAVLCIPFGCAHAGEQLLNLSKPPKGGRFQVKPRQWPAEHGQMDVCLWGHDKVACVTFGVDDNCAPEHDWWMEMGEKYDFRCTWFVIVWPMMHNYDGSKGTHHGGFFGDLKSFQRVFDAGHDVQMHGTTAINKFSREAYEKDVAFTQKMLAGIPGNEPNTYAYPGGEAGGHKREVVAKYCIGARGTRGAINRVNRVDYLNLDTSQVNHDSLKLLLDNPKGRYYRGWISQFVHLIGTSRDPDTKRAMYDSFEAKFKAVQARRDELWVPTYREAFLYAQSRDTAELTPGAVAAEEIRFNLSDDMKDAVYTYPLTIKVRVNNAWDAVTATQAGRDIEKTFVLYNGSKYLLVQAVPDQGEVVLKKTAPTQCLAPVGLPRSGVFRDKVVVPLTGPTRNSQIRYTTDGQNPTQDSPLYETPLTLSQDGEVTLKAACFRDGLAPSPVVAATYTIEVDKAPPAVQAVDGVAGGSLVAVTFSESINPDSAQTAGSYALAGEAPRHARLLADKRTVLITMSPLQTGTRLDLKAVRDLSGNEVKPEDGYKVHRVPARNETGLVGAYGFEESLDARVVLDQTGQAPVGLLQGPVKRTQTEKGPGLSLSAKGGVTAAPHSFGWEKSQALSAALWIRFTGPFRGRILQKGKYAVPFRIKTKSGRQALEVYVRAGMKVRFQVPGKLTRGEWIHLALTVGDGAVRIYRNGKQVCERKGRIRVKVPADPLWLGQGFQGDLAGVRLYDRVLAAEEVAKLAGD